MGKLTQTTPEIQAILDHALITPMTARGDLIVGGDSGAPARLPKGEAGEVLMSTANAPFVGWGTPGTGGDGEIVEMTYIGDLINNSQDCQWSFVDPNMTVSQFLTGVQTGTILAIKFILADAEITSTCYVWASNGYVEFYGENGANDNGECNIEGALTSHGRCFVIQFSLQFQSDGSEEKTVQIRELAPAISEE